MSLANAIILGLILGLGTVLAIHVTQQLIEEEKKKQADDELKKKLDEDKRLRDELLKEVADRDRPRPLPPTTPPKDYPPIVPPTEPPTEPVPPTVLVYVDDPDNPMKYGGRDPIMIGNWTYTENSDQACRSEHQFDFDNDGFGENMCYVPQGRMLVIDFGDGIKHGYNLLNFQRTQYDTMTPLQFMIKYSPCQSYSCYLWNDRNDDWIAQKPELEPYHYKLHPPISTQETKLPNHRYSYCHGYDETRQSYWCIKPTYVANALQDMR